LPFTVDDRQLPACPELHAVEHVRKRFDPDFQYHQILRLALFQIFQQPPDRERRFRRHAENALFPRRHEHRLAVRPDDAIHPRPVPLVPYDRTDARRGQDAGFVEVFRHKPDGGDRRVRIANRIQPIRNPLLDPRLFIKREIPRRQIGQSLAQIRIDRQLPRQARVCAQEKIQLVRRLGDRRRGRFRELLLNDPSGSVIGSVSQ